jgi:flagellar basal-body rod modification protein FlgD
MARAGNREFESQARRTAEKPAEGRQERMAAMAGILNHQLTAGQALTGAGATPMASTTTGSSSTDDSSSSSATISANDFLTLLVTEMQNQDPTADTDPNEYINQLVSVNSLEQLIDINQTLSSSLGTSATSSGSGSPSGQVASSPSSLIGRSASAQVHAAAQDVSAPAAARSAASAATTGNLDAQGIGARHAPGNLSIPAAIPAATRVAHVLDGRSHAQPVAGGLSTAQ